MDMNNIRNSRLPNRIEKFLFNDISRSARHRSSYNIPNFMDNRRTKTSLSEKDLVNQDFHEDSLKQITSKKSSRKLDKQLIPSVVVRRKPEDKLKNPDRISLDRQNLTSCPILDNEDNVRLLNYQYNYISQIQHLDRLRKLILLDLYDNRIEKISGLVNLKSLRVLMLGRNRIVKIEGLDTLTRLDVLDLHANCLQEIENINHLGELRVLNLAGNNIGCLTNLNGLYSLTEINVCRNCIESVIDINSKNCPNLHRIFLSYNNLNKISDFSCLINLSSLNELSVDNNPVCCNSNLRSTIIVNFTQLDQLDSRIISEDDRNRARQFLNRMEIDSKSNVGLSRHLNVNNHRPLNIEHQSHHNVHRYNNSKERRKGNLYNSQRILENWNQNGKNVSPRLSIKCFSNPSSSLFVSDSPINANASGDNDQNAASKSVRLNKSLQDIGSYTGKDLTAVDEPIVNPGQYQHLVSPKPSSKRSTVTRVSGSSPPLPKPESNKPVVIATVNAPDDFSSPTNKSNNVVITPETNALPKSDIELTNENEQMQFNTSSSLKVFEDKEFWIRRTGLSMTVMTVVFHHIDFLDVEKTFFQIKARFPSLKKMIFQSCNIRCYTQINSIASLKRLEELVIEKLDNPIVSFTLVRYYVIFRLAHLGLKKFNDMEITDHENIMARRYFSAMATIESNQILQFHLIGVISDLRKRELLQSNNSDNSIPVSIQNSTLTQLSSVNLDLVGKSGLLSNSATSEPIEATENSLKILSSKVIDRIMECVEMQCDLEVKFHDQWLSSIWQIICNRLTPMLINRHDYMKKQLDKVISQSTNVKCAISPSNGVRK